MQNKALQISSKVTINQISKNKATFCLEPLEPGYGHTLGNPLRRVLISSIQGYAITAIRFIEPADILHEFATIDGIVEDLTDIILNLKQIRLKQIKDSPPQKLIIDITDKEIFKAGDIDQTTDSYQILNPNHVICHMDRSTNIKLEITIRKGYGYISAEENESTTQTVNDIAIDSIFTPIRNVRYTVNNTLAGEKADYEKLDIEIETDGSITPIQAIQAAANNLINHFSLLVDEKEIKEARENLGEIIDEEKLNMGKKLATPVHKLGLSPRACNIFINNNIKCLGHIVQLTLPQITKFRNLGKATMREVQKVVARQNLTFGMDISTYNLGEEFNKSLTN